MAFGLFAFSCLAVRKIWRYQGISFSGISSWERRLYLQLNEAGFTLIYKEITYGDGNKIKGNCDADLVLSAVVDYYEHCFDRAVLVSSDGDFASLASFLKKKDVFLTLISPHEKCSYLLWKVGVPVVILDTQRNRLQLPQKEKAPDGDGTP